MYTRKKFFLLICFYVSNLKLMLQDLKQLFQILKLMFQSLKHKK